jgi:hypothetical protein
VELKNGEARCVPEAGELQVLGFAMRPGPTLKLAQVFAWKPAQVFALRPSRSGSLATRETFNLSLSGWLTPPSCNTILL